MKKKFYEQPQMQVIEVKQADIIATSTQGAFSLGGDGTLEQGNDSDWSTPLGW